MIGTVDLTGGNPFLWLWFWTTMNWKITALTLVGLTGIPLLYSLENPGTPWVVIPACLLIAYLANIIYVYIIY